MGPVSRRNVLGAGVSLLGGHAFATAVQPGRATTRRPASGALALKVGELHTTMEFGTTWNASLGVLLGADETRQSILEAGLSIGWSSREVGSPAQAASDAASLVSEAQPQAVISSIDSDEAVPAAVPVATAGAVLLSLAARESAQPAASPLRFFLRLDAGTRARALVRALAAADPGLEQHGAAELNERFTRRFGRPMSSSAWCGWAAVKALVEATLRHRPESARALAQALVALRFDGHKGPPLEFRLPDRRLVQPAYAVGRLPADGPGAPRVLSELAPHTARFDAPSAASKRAE